MRKAEKRKIGAARQAENRAAYERECKERLDKTREHRAEQQRLLMAEKARKESAKKINGMAPKTRVIKDITPLEVVIGDPNGMGYIEKVT